MFVTKRLFCLSWRPSFCLSLENSRKFSRRRWSKWTWVFLNFCLVRLFYPSFFLLQTSLERQNKEQFEEIKSLFKFCQGLAHVWDQHEAGLAQQERTMQENLDANRNRNDALNQVQLWLVFSFHLSKGQSFRNERLILIKRLTSCDKRHLRRVWRRRWNKWWTFWTESRQDMKTSQCSKRR